jgi:hypothetical protein
MRPGRLDGGLAHPSAATRTNRVFRGQLRDSQRGRHVDQLRHGLRIHLFHDPGAVDLNGALADAELARNDFIRCPFRHEVENLPFASRKCLEACPHGVMPTQLLANGAVTRERFLYAIEQLVLAERLLEKIERAMLHGFDGHRDVAVSGDEDDGRDRAASVELLLEIETAHAGHADIEQEAARLSGIVVRQKRGGTVIRDSVESQRFQEQAQGGAGGRIVIDDMDGGCAFRHGKQFAAVLHEGEYARLRTGVRIFRSESQYVSSTIGYAEARIFRPVATGHPAFGCRRSGTWR